MLTAEGCAARRRRLWESLPATCEVLIISDPQHLVYFANYAPSPFTFRTNDASALLIFTPGRSTLVGDNLLKPFLDRAHVDEVIAPTWYEGKRSAPDRRAMLARSALGALAKQAGRRIGIEPASLPSALMEPLLEARGALDLVDLTPTIRRLRRAKDPDELAVIGRSIRAGEAAHAAAMERIGPGMTEFEAYRLVEDAAQAAAGERVIVYGDFVSGPRGRATIGPPTDRVLEPGDLFILDFSAVVDGYRGDFANTLAIGGHPTDRQRALYEGCLAAMAAGEAMLRPGRDAREVDAAMRAAFRDRGLDPDYPTHSGHGIGLGHPEPPFIVPESEDVLSVGDVVALEPGQYGDDFGGLRFERNYVIIPGGFETLTHHELALGRRD